MCSHHSVKTREFCLSCWSTAGQAPSMSSTGSYHFLLRIMMELPLRSFVPQSLAMVSQMHRRHKVQSFDSHLSLLTSAWECEHCALLVDHFPFRIWLPGSCKDFFETDGAFGVLQVLPAGWRLGLPYHHQHGTDEATVRQLKNSYMPQPITAVQL